METFPATQPASCDHNGESQIEDEIRAIIKKCLTRVRSWPIPRNWSYRDWFYEAEEVATVSAWQALLDNEPPVACALPYFVRQRALSSVRTRYRQEYLYGLRFANRLAEPHDDTDGELTDRLSLSAEPVGQPLTHVDLTEALAQLSSDHRQVIEQLFFSGRTEMQIAALLKISRVAVNKRKQAALRLLREFLQEK